MNDEAARQGRPDTTANHQPNGSRTRRAPALDIRVEIESSSARVSVSAQSEEDQAALFAWLRRRPRILASLADIESLLATLDRDTSP